MILSMDVWMDMDEWMGGCWDGWVVGWMDGWEGDQVEDGWMDE